jgi:hypothetical protein
LAGYSIPASAKSPPVLPHVGDSLDIPKSTALNIFAQRATELSAISCLQTRPHPCGLQAGGVHGGFEKAKLRGSDFFPYALRLVTPEWPR